MIKIPYNFKKAFSNCAFIYTGVLLVRLAPYLDQLTLGNVPPDLQVWNFWRHIIVSGLVVTGVAELKYIYQYLATMNGNTPSNIQPIIKDDNIIGTVTKDAKKNPLSLS